jgi:hypothetical protein
MQRLAELERDVVSDVDDGVNGSAKAGAAQPSRNMRAT